MQVKMLGGGSFYGPHGVMVSYAPGSVVDVDDSDEVAVKYWTDLADSGAAEVIEKPEKASTTKASTKDDDTKTSSTEKGADTGKTTSASKSSGTSKRAG